jgi:NAD+ synthase (glutamine-hydrolysing)
LDADGPPLKTLRVGLAQINTTVGDFSGNRKKIIQALRQAEKAGVRLLVFPELALTGYPPEDLLFKKSFVDRNLQFLRSLLPFSKRTLVVLGFIDRDKKGRLYNAAAALYRGRLQGCYRKIELPNYGVFDEKRYFQPGHEGLILRWGELTIGLSICEDIWQRSSFVYRPPYKKGLSLLINLSASPFHADKQRERSTLLKHLAKTIDAGVIYNNLVGGQDELVFDGGSMIVSSNGKLLAAAPLFEETLLAHDVPVQPRTQTKGFVQIDHPPILLISKKPPKTPLSMPHTQWGSVEAQVYRALVMGTRDYVQKNGFKKVLVGLSGGVDSALVARIAVDALGAGNVVGLTMPSRFTSRGTYRDAARLASQLGVRCHEISIEKIYSAYLELLRPFFSGRTDDATEENLQSRVRGNLLMALSNKLGYLVLTTGNKRELATGYCTLYGDMAGGFAVIKDVPKTLVFRLTRFRNRWAPKNSIPESILRRAPSAELRHNQKDQDTLPPYPLLDRILKDYVENDLSGEVIARRMKASRQHHVVRKVLQRVDGNEYKRRQAPLGIKITPKAFGRDRRMPITNKFS